MPWTDAITIDLMHIHDKYRNISWTMVAGIKNALIQNRKAMFYPDESEYDKDKKKYL